MGKQSYLATRSIVYHHGNITVGSDNDHKKYTMNEMNKRYFEKKWGKQWKSRNILSLILSYKPENMIKYKCNNQSLKYFKNINNATILKNNKWLYDHIILNNQNSIDIDCFIYKYLNNKNIRNLNTYKDIHDNAIESGKIYSIKQIINHTNIDTFYKIKQKIYCKYNDYYIDIRLIAYKLYERSFIDYIKDIELIENTLIHKNIDTAICNFIGNIDIGVNLINHLLKSDKLDLPQIFIFNTNINIDIIRNKLILFKNRIVFRTREYGNDIIPTLQSLYYMKKYNLQYIFKFHTKTNKSILNKYTNYLLTKSVSELKSMLENHYSNCVGYGYKNIDRERLHCVTLLNKYSKYFDKKNFVLYCIFFTNIEVINTIFNFIENNNYLGYFMNNLYDTNTILMDNSPVHFLERLFGIIKY